jgi:hypothetical protein
MKQHIAMLTEGRLSRDRDRAERREGEGQGLSRTAAETEPLTFILSPSQGERREKTSILLLQK